MQAKQWVLAVGSALLIVGRSPAQGNVPGAVPPPPAEISYEQNFELPAVEELPGLGLTLHFTVIAINKGGVRAALLQLKSWLQAADGPHDSIEGGRLFEARLSRRAVDEVVRLGGQLNELRGRIPRPCPAFVAHPEPIREDDVTALLTLTEPADRLDVLLARPGMASCKPEYGAVIRQLATASQIMAACEGTKTPLVTLPPELAAKLAPAK